VHHRRQPHRGGKRKEKTEMNRSKAIKESASTRASRKIYFERAKGRYGRDWGVTGFITTGQGRGEKLIVKNTWKPGI